MQRPLLLILVSDLLCNRHDSQRTYDALGSLCSQVDEDFAFVRLDDADFGDRMSSLQPFVIVDPKIALVLVCAMFSFVPWWDKHLCFGFDPWSRVFIGKSGEWTNRVIATSTCLWAWSNRVDTVEVLWISRKTMNAQSHA